jgi:hypothetical protein
MLVPAVPQKSNLPLYPYKYVCPCEPVECINTNKGVYIVLGPVLQSSGSSKNGSDSDSFGGVAFLMELKLFWKTFDKMTSPV